MAPDRQTADHASVSGAPTDLGTSSEDRKSQAEVYDPVRKRRRKRRRRRWQRLSRRGRLVCALIVGLLVLALVWTSVSYTVWMLRPTSLSWKVNSVEWVRYNVPFGIGNWVADHLEQDYYSSQAPKGGGPQLKSLPKVGVKHTAAPATTIWPPAIAPIFTTPLPGEGFWRPTGLSVDGAPPVLVTTYRPDPNYPQVVAYVAWFDHT